MVTVIGSEVVFNEKIMQLSEVKWAFFFFLPWIWKYQKASGPKNNILKITSCHSLAEQKKSDDTADSKQLHELLSYDLSLWLCDGVSETERVEICLSFPLRSTVTACFLLSWAGGSTFVSVLSWGSCSQLGERRDSALEVLPRNEGLFGWTVTCGCKKHLLPFVSQFWWFRLEWALTHSCLRIWASDAHIYLSVPEKVTNRMIPYAKSLNIKCFISYLVTCHKIPRYPKGSILSLV